MDQSIASRIEQLFPEMVERRRYLHQHPELSFHEVETPNYIASRLEELGIEVRRNVGGRGIVGTIRGGKPGKTVALRADFDALPIQDEKTVDYRSTVPGVMHACGHDGHTATLLAVAEVLVSQKEQLTGNVVLIHQHAEEVVPGGAREMIADGCLDGVDVIFGTHLWSTTTLGTIGTRVGPVMAAADKFELTLFGRGGHGAKPHETIDAVLLGATIVKELQSIVSRRLDPLQQAVLTIGTLHAGNTFNVIADRAQLTGTVRTFDETVAQKIVSEMERTIKGICDAAGATYTFHYETGYPAVINDLVETRFLEAVARDVIGDTSVFEIDPTMGGEDFAYYLKEVPGTFFFTGAGDASHYPHHHPRFDFEEPAMVDAAKILVEATLRYLATR
ncbi:N-acetyl amino acid acetylase, promiscuous activity [Exiguobacterium oxidotolerans]|uniref:N-acetyl amino acid acetylase, promiscuous activity n=2 Tax=Exiguobacterium oxidotolerans TaxID=223958 RepID=A0A653IGR7_9BACL|nr:M20 family metallopeptidase [Exiguobacterium oxidotolerans]VWX38229.1 N-acetyl amino acid acetylase, promiscuous activity [Exiguobacterium oxidotolerans]